MNEENKKMTLEEKTRSALNWSTASNVLSKLIMPLTNMILARLLTKDIFGIVASINIVIALAEIFADSGFSKYLVQADFESDKQFELHKSVSFWTSTGISLVMFLLIVIFRDSLATLIGSSGYGLVLAIAAIQIPIYSFSSISTAILRRNFEFKKLFFVRMSGVVITLTVSVIFALLKFEHWSLIIGSLSSIVIQTVILFILSNFKAKFIFSFSVLKQMIYFSINSFLEALLAWAASSIILAFVNIKLGNDISGIYKMGNTTASGIFNMFSAIFIPVLFSNLSRQKEDNREFDSTYFAYQRSAAYVIIPAVIGVTIFRPLIVNIFLGSGWSEVEEIIAFQAIALIINILFRSFPGTYFLAKGKPQKLVITQIIWLIMYLPVSYFAIDLGIVNFVKINVILNFILCLITYVWLWFSYKVSIKETLLVLIKPIIISVPMVIIGLLSYKISTNLYLQLGVIIMCVFIYFGTFYLVFKNDFKKLISLFTKSEKIEKKTSVINSARLGEKMRIVQIIPSLQIVGGAERFVVDLAIAQQKLGHDVLIISLYEKGKCYFEQDIIDNNLNVVFLNKKKGFDWKNSRLLRKTILDFKPDVVNTHIVSHLSMQLSGLWKRKSTITFFHTEMSTLIETLM